MFCLNHFEMLDEVLENHALLDFRMPHQAVEGHALLGFFSNAYLNIQRSRFVFECLIEH